MAKAYLGANLLSSPNLGNTPINQSVQPRPIEATGGLITFDGNYKIHTFTSSGDFTVDYKSSTNTFDILVVGGGGGGGTTLDFPLEGGPSGGGAGGLIYSQSYSDFTTGTYSVVVGAGGAVNSSGNSSSFNDLIALGGGNGLAGGLQGGTGGSGGGSTGFDPNEPGVPISGGLGTPGQGFDGGEGSGGPSGTTGGGGGGASEAGYAGVGGFGGNGGNGLQIDISGTPIYYAGGGAGVRTSGTPVVEAYGTGGLGGGGNSGSWAGAPNTGGGGAGKYAFGQGTGGSGVVIIRYQYK
jgi:hypothetical protein